LKERAARIHCGDSEQPSPTAQTPKLAQQNGEIEKIDKSLAYIEKPDMNKPTQSGRF
jgi:hypothetical protein